MGNERPEQACAEQAQQRRHHEQYEKHRDHQSARRMNPEAAGGGRCSEDKRRQCQYDGRIAGDDGRPRAADRGSQCCAMIVGAGQFLAIARDQQQSVVRARTEHEDAGDSRGGAVERQTRHA